MPPKASVAPRKRVHRADAKAELVRYWERLTPEARANATRDGIAEAIRVSSGLTSELMEELGLETKGKRRKAPTEPRTVPIDDAFAAVLPGGASAFDEKAAETLTKYFTKFGHDDLVKFAEVKLDTQDEEDE